MGLKPVAHVLGGFKAWKEAGGPVEPGGGQEVVVALRSPSPLGEKRVPEGPDEGAFRPSTCESPLTSSAL